MNKVLKMKYLLPLSLLPAAALVSCNVHEWPKESEEVYPFILYMDFDQELPLHKEVYYTRGANDDSRAESDYDIRYTVNVYEVNGEDDNNRYVVDTYTFTQPYAENHNYNARLNLPEGKYKFRVWSDFVKAGTVDDNFYLTSDFTEIKLDESGSHPGASEMRDAFRGTAYGEVYDPELYAERNGKTPDNSATAEMKRPMGRYEFISTDMDEFLDKILQTVDTNKLAALRARAEQSRTDTKGEIFWNGLTRDEVAEAAGLDKYTVRFAYNAFMPTSYNLYTDKPSDASTGITYDSKMQVGSEGMQLGFDYVLVDEETTMNLNMGVYDDEGDMISSVSGVSVPVARSKNTVVKGAFLTVNSGGGVTINPDFEGDDFNIEIK